MFLSKTSVSNVAPSTTDANIITGMDAKVIRVIGGWVVAAGTATNITFNTKPIGSGTVISSTIYCGINGGLVMPLPTPVPFGQAPFGYFDTNKGDGLTVTTGAGASVGVTVVYVTLG